jgi:hypothetical protein
VDRKVLGEEMKLQAAANLLELRVKRNTDEEASHTPKIPHYSKDYGT